MGEQTGDAYSVFELNVPPNVVAGLHIDKDWDEWWHVMEGTFAFTLNGDRIELSAGGFAYGPKVFHTVSKMWAKQQPNL